MVGASIREANRHEDNAGIDATLTAWGPFESGYLKEVDLKLQLKATISQPSSTASTLSYELRGIERYNDLRVEAVAIPRLLVVLYLPPEPNEWLVANADSLILKRCAYWVSLCGAPESQNKTSITVYIPKEQVFHPDGLRSILARLSRRERLAYDRS